MQAGATGEQRSTQGLRQGHSPTRLLDRSPRNLQLEHGEICSHVCHCAEAFLSVVDLIPEVDVEVAATLERVSGTARQSNVQASKATPAKPGKDAEDPQW